MKEYKKFEKNPFLIELRGRLYLQPRANMVIAKNEAIVDTDTGEISKEKSLIGRQKMVDKSDFTKIYCKSIGSLMELKPNTIKVLIYLAEKSDYENKALLNYNADFKKLGYKTPNSVFKGICELLKNGIIALSDYTHLYWINPLYICKGERFAIYTEYIKDETGGTYGEAVKNVMGEKNADKQLPLFSSKNEQIDPYADEKKENEPELSNENKIAENEAQEKE